MHKFVYKPFTFRSYTSLSPNFRLLAASIVHMRILYYSVLDRIVILKNELKQLRVKIRYVKRHFKTIDRKRWKAKWESSSPQQFSNTCWAASYALCLHWLMPRHKCTPEKIINTWKSSSVPKTPPPRRRFALV